MDTRPMSLQRHYPRHLKLKQLIVNTSAPVKGETRTFGLFPNLPSEIRLAIYRQCDMSTLFRVAQTTRQMREEASEVFYAQRHYWFTYHDTTFGKGLSGVIKGSGAPGSLSAECLLAASKVTQLKISTAPMDPGEESTWDFLNSPALWTTIYTYFPSLRRVMFSLRCIRTADCIPDAFWDQIKSRPARVDIWIESWSPGGETFFKVEDQRRTLQQGLNSDLARSLPDHPLSVYVKDYLQLPRLTGRVARFIRYLHLQELRARQHHINHHRSTDLENARVAFDNLQQEWGSPKTEMRSQYERRFLAQLQEDPLFPSDSKKTPIWSKLQEAMANPNHAKALVTDLDSDAWGGAIVHSRYR